MSRAAAGHAWYDVHREVFPFGIREYLGRIQAPTRKEADRIAAELHGKGISVTLSCKPRRARRRIARDLGDAGRKP
jgi:hypothetical protein